MSGDIADAVCAEPSCGDRDAIAEGDRLLRSWLTAWNRADQHILRAIPHLPYVHVPGSRLLVRETEADLLQGSDYRALASLEGWHHSTLDRVDMWLPAPDKLHCALTYGRYAADGQRYADGEGVCIITHREGRWGIQLNSATLRPIARGSDSSRDSVTAAEDVVRRWIGARERGDAAALGQLVHLPFVELRGSRLVVHGSVATLRLATGSQGPDAGWSPGTRPRLTVRERSAAKVTLEVEPTRPHGAVRDSALCIVAERDGRWALQVWSEA